jgi:hypothetical protein
MEMTHFETHFEEIDLDYLSQRLTGSQMDQIISRELNRETTNSTGDTIQNSSEEVIFWRIDRIPSINLNFRLEFGTRWDGGYPLNRSLNPREPSSPRAINQLIEHTINTVFSETPIDNTKRILDEVEILVDSFELEEGADECCICIEKKEKNEMCKLGCNHAFCGGCVSRIAKTKKEPCCALCRKNIEKITVQNEAMKNLFN